MCRIGSGFRLVDSIALFRQRRCDFCSVLLRQIEGPRDPWLAGFRDGAQSRAKPLRRQFPTDEISTGFEMKGGIAPRIKWGGQSKDEACEQVIYFRNSDPAAVLALYSVPCRIGFWTE